VLASALVLGQVVGKDCGRGYDYCDRGFMADKARAEQEKVNRFAVRCRVTGVHRSADMWNRKAYASCVSGRDQAVG
jgi:hypothetical protein